MRRLLCTGKKDKGEEVGVKRKPAHDVTDFLDADFITESCNV